MNFQTQAIQNNVSWCDLVFRTYGHKTALYPQYWVHRGTALPYYPDLITLAPTLSSQAYDEIQKLSVGSYIKDSYAKLDLTALGYVKVFKNTWLACPPQSSNQIIPDILIETVQSQERLLKWMTAWNPEGETASQAFHPKLLHNPDVEFIAVVVEDKTIAGAIFNAGPVGVIGISNLFGNYDNQKKIISSAIKTYPKHTIVTYENDSEAATYQEFGFVTIGSLAVWHRKEYPHKSQA